MRPSDNRNSSRMNRQPLHSAEEVRSEEKWKTSPSTEVTSDEGENARAARRRSIDEKHPARTGTSRAASGANDDRDDQRLLAARLRIVLVPPAS